MKIDFTRNVIAAMAIGAATLAVGSAQADTGAAVELLQNDETGVVLRYEFAAPTMKNVRDGLDAKVVIELGDESISAAAGEPAIADVRRSISIGPNASVAASIIDGDFVEISDVDVAPSKGPILRTIDPSTVPYTYGDVYDQDAFWPAEAVELGSPYIIRNQRGVVVDVNPVQYNPVTRTLRVYRNMTVMVEPVGLANDNVLNPRRDKKVDGSAFHGIYKNHFINYERDLRYDPIESEGDLLVICHDSFMSDIQPFVDHKNGIGISTMLVAVSAIGNNPTSIQNYINTMYASEDLVYVLLVGDIAQISSPTVPIENGLSDPTYALQTADMYPDIIMGRFSGETSADIATQVERTIAFETENWTQRADYKHALGIASNQGPGDDNETDDQHVANIMADLVSAGYTDTEVIADPSGTVSQAVNFINSTGCGAIAYCGHGSVTCWGNGAPLCNSDVNGLTNTEMLPWIVSVACVNGQFNAGTCFGETWMRATYGGQPSGAIAIYASSVNQYWAEPMSAEDEIFDLFVAETYVTYGALCYAGSCLMMDEYGSSGEDMYLTWHIFGDPTLRVVGTTAPPTGMVISGSGFQASGPNGGPFTPDTADLVVTNYDDTDLTYTTTVDVDWLDVANGEGVVGAGEGATITVSLNALANSLGNGPYVGTVNITGSNGDSVDKEFNLDVGTPVAIHTFDMSSNPGWSMEGEWAWGSPSGGGGSSYGNPDPNGGFTGANVCGVDLNGDYNETVGSWNLTTTAIDCSNLTETGLKFQRWLNSDYQPYVRSFVEISNDGSTWTMLWENGTSEITDNSWSLQEFDISSVADQQSTVYVRWGYEVGQYAWTYSGWNLDDVEIWGVAPDDGPDCPTDLDGNGTTDVNDILALIAAWGTPNGDVTGDGYTDVNDVLLILAEFGNPC
ncbi:MAG: C25 family cysteine peptidase [Phycisphaerales bacterium]|nr:C25 family cysteine peptidase [Phycisphaerales bacterium]